MNHTKEFKKENGDKIRISVDLLPPMYGDMHKYMVQMSVCKKGKRKWIFVHFNDYLYRGLTAPEKEVFRNKTFADIAGEDRILEAKMELWNKLKP